MKKLTCLILVTAFLLACIPALATDTAAQAVTLMNCDTGRYITDSNGNQTFTMTTTGAGTVFQTESGQYLDLRGSAAALSASAIQYTVQSAEYNRHQIILPSGNYVYDNNEGTDNTASIAASDVKTSINTGWYITPANEKAPLKILTLGDSLTYGVNLDLSGQEPRVSYRKTLSNNLLDYFGEVVFVGNENQYPTNINLPFMLRHSGYSGYVIEDVYHVKDHPGVKPMIDDMMKKYQPDIVIMMLGTNDLGLSTMVSEIIPRWENFVKQVEAQLPEDGYLLCSALPPIETSTKEQNFNEKIQSRIHALANEGYKIGFVDPHTPMNDDAKIFLNSDGVHFNSLGYNEIGEIFTKAIQTAYTSEGEKVSPNPLIPTDPYAEPAPSESETQTTGKESPSISPIVIILGAIGFLVIVAVVVLIVLVKKKK